MNTPRILFADDEPAIRDLVKATLEKSRMACFLATNGAEAIQVWQANSPLDMIVLDVRMPGMDGLDVCRHIRQISRIPIMILTVEGSEADVVKGFDAGADDYMIKPFRPKEFISRIHAILQRFERPLILLSSRLTQGDLVLDATSQTVTRRGEKISVSTLEAQLLAYLMQRIGHAVSKEELFKDVWGYELPSGAMNLIEVAVSRLREKIEADPSHPRYIHTVRGAGYRFGD